MKIGGNAKLVKKAVAPAIRSGSFVLISAIDRLINFQKIDMFRPGNLRVASFMDNFIYK